MPVDDLQRLSELFSRDLRDAVGDAVYEVWLEPLRVRSFDGELLVLDAPRETRGWIAERFGRVLETCAAAVVHPGVIVHLEGLDRTAGSASSPAERVVSAGVPAEGGGTTLNPKYTFDQFVLGSANRFGHAAALAVAENPGTAYNPLVLCGPPGVGKTHLLHAIGNYLAAYGDGLRVRATTAEAFANGFIAAVRGGDIDAFKARHRHIDVLLVDDVQFLMAKARTEEEFFHTFNALRDAGAQVVLTSDRPPRELDGLQERLRDRVDSGLVAEMRPPDPSTRRAALHKRAELDGLGPIDPEVLELLVRRVTLNVRNLESALIRVVAYASLTGRHLDVDLAAEVLDELHGSDVARGAEPTVEEVQDLTCEAFGLTREELLSPSRTARITWARQVAMYLSRRHTGASLPVIGAGFAGRGHSTVLHACRRADARLARDPQAAAMVNELSTRLSGVAAPRRADRQD